MIELFADNDLLSGGDPFLLWVHDDDKILAFQRDGWIFVFNFHPSQSYAGYGIPAPGGAYQMTLDTDAAAFGGYGRLAPDQHHHSFNEGSRSRDTRLHLYLPSRTGLVLRPSTAAKEES
jgi:1,4-alpha-glucan branching enzyme